MRYIATIFSHFSLAHPKSNFLPEERSVYGTLFSGCLPACFGMCVCVKAFGKFAYSHSSMMCYRCICVWMCMNCGLNIVMNFFVVGLFIIMIVIRWNVPYKIELNDNDNGDDKKKKKRVLRKFHQHCLFLLHILSSSSSSLLLVAVQLLFHSNDFHFIKFHWNHSNLTFNFLPFFSHLPIRIRVLCDVDSIKIHSPFRDDLFMMMMMMMMYFTWKLLLSTIQNALQHSNHVIYLNWMKNSSRFDKVAHFKDETKRNKKQQNYYFWSSPT